MRILHVLNDPKDFDWHRAPLAHAARARGHEVHIVAPAGDALASARAAGYPVHEYALDRRGTSVLSDASTVRQLARIYRAARPDLVHHFTIKPVIYGGAAARLARVPATVSTITGLGHVFLSTGLRGRVLRAIARRGFRNAFGHPRSLVIFQNDDDRAAFLREKLVDPARTRMVRGSGVDTAHFHPTPEPAGAPVVLLASRLLREKGVVEFVEAARLVRAKEPSVRFVLAGAPDPGNPSSLSRAEVEAWVAEGIVEWWGERRDMPAVMAAANVVCLPSYREGLPKVLLEAMACARAIVTTDTPGCRDLVAEDNGLLVPVGDGGALAAAAQRLVDDAALRQRMGAAGRRLVEREFSVERITREIVDLYEELGAPPAA